MRFHFDHVVVVVESLTQAVERYAAAGFSVSPGGRHDVLPTENALIPFADGSYLELIAVRDPETREDLRALAASDRWEHHLKGVSAIGRRFLPRLAGAPGVCDYVLTGSDLERFAAAARRRGVAMTGPVPLEREKPDGTRLAMRLLLPADGQWPFLIEDRTPRALRVPEGAAATTHPNGATGIASVTVQVAAVPVSALELAGLFDVTPRVDGEGRTRLRLAGIEVVLIEGGPAGAREAALVGVGRLPPAIEAEGIRTAG